MNSKLPGRRTILRGAGVALACPRLDLDETSRQSIKPPVRTAFLHFPNGAWMADWTPLGDGESFEFSPMLRSLQKLRSHVTVISGLDKAHSVSGDGHYAKTANFLTGLTVRKTVGRDISAGGISADQLLAKGMIGVTPVPSLVLSAGRVYSGIDRTVGFTKLYASYISWASVNRPVTPDVEPGMVYQRLFGIKRGTADTSSTNRQKLLDLVLEDARSLRRRLGRDDISKLDEFLDSVRSVESRIEFQRNQSAGDRGVDWSAIPEASRFSGLMDFRDHIQAMLDLIVLAFQTDTTRVVSMMMSNGISGQSFQFLDGVTGGHHEVSHHREDPALIVQYQKITTWYVEQFSNFLQKLASTSEGPGTLLDSCQVMFGSGMSDGNTHDPMNLPIVLAGGADRLYHHGRHVVAGAGNMPLCNLYVSMLQRAGMSRLESFGDSTGALMQQVPHLVE